MDDSQMSHWKDWKFFSHKVSIGSWNVPLGAQLCASLTNWHELAALFKNLIGHSAPFTSYTHCHRTATLILKKKNGHSLVS